MGLLEEIFGDKIMETSRNHTDKDINPYYVYLMQNEFNEIISIYKVPYNQSNNGGWRLNDFISDNIQDEIKEGFLHDYRFRCYYIPQGNVLPEVQKDNLNTFWQLIDRQQLGILEKEIDLKNAAYASTCAQPFFRPDGTAFDGQEYNQAGWNEFLEKDDRKYIIDKFEELKSSLTKHLGREPYNKTEYISQMSDLIFTANRYKGLVPKLYDSLQNFKWNENKKQITELQQKWLFPAFFATNFGSHKWDDKDMLKFIEQTGTEAIRFAFNQPEMEDFFKRQRLIDIIDNFRKNTLAIKSNVILGDKSVGEGGISCMSLEKDLKTQCTMLLTRQQQECVTTSAQIGQRQQPTAPETHIHLWEEQNQPDISSQNPFEQLKRLWSNQTGKTFVKEEQVSFTPSIKY